MNDKTELMRSLVLRLNAAADAYYNGQGEMMSDFEWDALFDQLKALEAETGFSLPDSPTGKVSADDVVGQKEAHEFAALSLAKTKKIEDVVKWAEGRPIWISWKLDGLTLVVTYDGGHLSKVVTRGDGHVGTNITHLAAGIGGIPQEINYRGHLVVRGEAVISYADFAEFVASSQEEYANPRNLAAGSLSLKDLEELKKRKLQWIPFTLVHVDEGIVSWGGQMEFLERAGFSVVEREMVALPDAGTVSAVIDQWTARVVERKNPFPVDGLVVVYDDTEYAKTGSVTGHHAVRAGYAFKWQDETATTELETIEWSCAVASISPVAIFKPVQLEGTTVRRALLCNISECERLGIGGKGTMIEVIKANKIIPKVVAVTSKVGELRVPERCPVCGAATQVEEGDRGTKTLHCTNPNCAARTLRKFMRFVSKDGMDIDGISGMTLARFVNLGWIKTAADIYRLGEHQAEIAAMDGFGEKSAANIVSAIAEARHRSAARLLVALSIPLCGLDVAKRLLAAYKVRELFELARTTEDREVFSAIDGIGSGKSMAFVNWCKEEKNARLVDELFGLLDLEEQQAAPLVGACAGLTFVITGDVHKFANRNELKAFIEARAGKVTGSVSKSTSFLINNDASSTSGKNKKAAALGIPILTEDEFLTRFSETV